MLIHNPLGNYRFLKGIDPYSCGVIADDGFEIVHATLAEPAPWRKGFTLVERYLEQVERPRTALCAMQLRCPAPYPMEGFIDFNKSYCRVLEEWGLYVDGLNPLARTNVAPFHPPSEPQLFAFSYTTPIEATAPATAMPRTFVVAGAGELREGHLDPGGILRRGETDPDALREKARYVVEVMNQRIAGLQADPHSVTQIDVYTVHALDILLPDVVIPGVSASYQRGLHWYPSRPPVEEIEFEMDLRGIRRELRI